MGRKKKGGEVQNHKQNNKEKFMILLKLEPQFSQFACKTSMGGRD
jgi:hypothetical protein